MRLALPLAAALILAGGAAAADLVNRAAPSSVNFTNRHGDLIASVWADPDTGCEYLIRGDVVVPRLDRGGRPRCPD